MTNPAETTDAIFNTLSWPVMYPLGLIQSHVKTTVSAVLRVVRTIDPHVLGWLQPTRPILQGFNGVLKPGEMCLVLGVPGAGCSTFLKTVANQRGEYAKVEGEVSYAGISAEEMAKTYAGEVVYNQEGLQLLL